MSVLLRVCVVLFLLKKNVSDLLGMAKLSIYGRVKGLTRDW